MVTHPKKDGKSREEVKALCHWEKAKQDLKTRLWFLYEQSICTDIKFQLTTGDGNELFIDAHKAMLIAISRFFYNHYIVNPQGDTVHAVPSEVKESSFRKLIRYAYRDEISFDSLVDVLDVFVSAKAFEAPGLVSHCTDYLMDVPITRENFIDCLENATKMNCKSKIDQCGKFVGPIAQDIFKSDFLNCSCDAAIKLLSAEDLSPASEYEILEGAIAWAQNSVTKGAPKEDLQDIMLKFASCVHFPSIPPQLLAQFILKYPNVFSNDTLLDIFKLVISPRKIQYESDPPCRREPRFKPQPLELEFSGPVWCFPTVKFLIPFEREMVEKEAELLQCKLTVCPTKPVLLWGILIYCRDKSREEVKLRYQVQISENFGDSSEYVEEITCTFEDYLYTLMFKDPLKLKHTCKLELWVYLKFQMAQVFILPKILEDMPPHTIFATCGRQHLLYGDIIITELYYTDKLIAA